MVFIHFFCNIEYVVWSCCRIIQYLTQKALKHLHAVLNVVLLANGICVLKVGYCLTCSCHNIYSPHTAKSSRFYLSQTYCHFCSERLEAFLAWAFDSLFPSIVTHLQVVLKCSALYSPLSYKFIGLGRMIVKQI